MAIEKFADLGNLKKKRVEKEIEVGKAGRKKCRTALIRKQVMERRGSRGKETWGKVGIERIAAEIAAGIIP